MRSRPGTLDSCIAADGIGLHSGKRVSMTLHPAPAASGIVFVRQDAVADMADREIVARYDCVSATRLSTRLTNAAGNSVATVEHLLAACLVCGVDNLRIELDAGEVPIMDGSAAPFARLMRQAGVRLLDEPLRCIRILRPVSVTEGNKHVELSPYGGTKLSRASHDSCDGFAIEVEIDFGDKVIGRQSCRADTSKTDFSEEILPARTFAFAHEVAAMRQQGLALGGSLDNAIVVGADGILNSGGLRYDNEFARHKLLDALGDLFLAGAPILGRYRGHAPGHALNNALLHKLFATPTAWEYLQLP